MGSLPHPAQPQPRAAIYCRVSTAGQREDGTSLETQLAACRVHAERLGYTVPPEFVFMEDWPGTTLDRPDLDLLRGLAQEGALSAVVCYATDRLSRDPIHLAILVQELERRGCALELVTEPLDGSPEGQLLQFVRGWAGKLEHAKIIERTGRGKREAARRGRLPTGSTLYGYRYIKGEGRCEVDPEEAEVVRTIYRWYTEERLPQGSIALRLTDLGIQPPTHGGRGGDRWHRSTVARILTNSSYVGRAEAFKWVCVPPVYADPERRRRYKNSRKEARPVEQRIPVADAVPAIITPDVWGAAVATRERNRVAASRNTRRAYLLAGHIVCAWCRRRYGATAARKWTYYYCPGAKSTARSQRCRNSRISTARLEADIWSRVEAVLADPSIITAEVERLRGTAGAEAGVRAELALIDSALERLVCQERRLVRLFRFGEIDEALIASESHEIKRERERLELEETRLTTRLEQADRTAKSLEGVAAYCERVRQRLGTLDYAGRRLALEALGVKVTVDGAEWRVEAVIPVDSGDIALQPS